jgi:hypothetical protein
MEFVDRRFCFSDPTGKACPLKTIGIMQSSSIIMGLTKTPDWGVGEGWPLINFI